MYFVVNWVHCLLSVSCCRSLEFNMLSGPIPSSLGSMTSLISLWDTWLVAKKKNMIKLLTTHDLPSDSFFVRQKAWKKCFNWIYSLWVGVLKIPCLSVSFWKSQCYCFQRRALVNQEWWFLPHAGHLSPISSVGQFQTHLETFST